MNRVMNDDDKIRRAEEILERRSSYKLYNENTQSEEVKKRSIRGKLFIKLFICLCIYCGLYYVKNANNNKLNVIFENTKNVLEYDVNFKEVCSMVGSKLKWFKSENQENYDENSNNNEENILTNDASNKTDNVSVGIGGETDNIDGSYIEDNQVDVEIRNNISMIKPLEEYMITSPFGVRESNNIVSANHKGIDLGARAGSTIVSSTDGLVTEASAEGDFGLHLIISTENISIIYGHCSELMVGEGEIITQGQEIAKVGSTGKATGPHLHFEIRKDGTSIDPESLIEF